ncbi:ribose-5-phosphate isomerase RpiA [Peribacillus sp. SCS-37]|uniref:ribose-5-phosphate isomerase RpiA n=1 Tax=Paraperibacillus esterisolvens TaxID=3115296 RepID=UPI0039067397
MESKRLAGEEAAGYVENNMIVGLGTGSTIYYTLLKLADLIKNHGLNIRGIPTSKETEKIALELGIPLLAFKEAESIDLAIDGTDASDQHLNMIKGGGGALLREKIVAHAAKRFIVAADRSKLVRNLASVKLPVEVVPFGMEMTKKHLQALGCTTEVRMKGDSSFVTDNGNHIIDCSFKEINNPGELEKEINLIPGAVENGLFVGMAERLITVNDKSKIVYVKAK